MDKWPEEELSAVEEPFTGRRPERIRSFENSQIVGCGNHNLLIEVEIDKSNVDAFQGREKVGGENGDTVREHFLSDRNASDFCLNLAKSSSATPTMNSISMPLFCIQGDDCLRGGEERLAATWPGWGGGVGFGGPESDNGATYGDGIGCEGCEYYSFLHLKTYNATLSDVFRLEYLPFTYSQC
ncbi:Hypothetical predicted protein [Olea europaea subsp. europaea]|uniref:Uncharacterized protein n=1 Tax=Olea europaea subsp. europaea TaxID=158383 RepID=A0A8S0Q9A3_OLEEU|nr:Hypothetical predicted protein [Olea europaea subsp. europaea]